MRNNSAFSLYSFWHLTEFYSHFTQPVTKCLDSLNTVRSVSDVTLKTPGTTRESPLSSDREMKDAKQM